MGCCTFKIDPNGAHKPDTSFDLQNIANRQYFIIGSMINHPQTQRRGRGHRAHLVNQEDVVLQFKAFENGQIQVDQMKGIYSIPTQQFTYVQLVQQLRLIPTMPGVYKVDMGSRFCLCCLYIENMFVGSSPSQEWLLLASGVQNSPITILVDINCLGNIAAYYAQIQQALAQNNYQGYYYQPAGISQNSIMFSTQITHGQFAVNGANPGIQYPPNMMMFAPETAQINQIPQTNQMVQMAEMNQMPQMVPQYVNPKQLAAQPGAQPNQQYY